MSNRATLAAVATVLLVLLTLLTGYLVEQDASAWQLAGTACLKVVVIGVVFLELDRARLLWGAMLGLVTALIAFGAVLLMGG